MPSENERTRVGDRVSIYTRGKTKIYCADFWHEGKHRRVSLETRNKKVATQRAVKIDADLASGKYTSAPPPTSIQAAVDSYMAYLESEGRARKTIVRYRGELNSFREFCTGQDVTRLGQITMLLFDAFRADRRSIHSERTVHHESVVVKQFLKWCRQRKLVAGHPLEDYRLDKPHIDQKEGPSLEQVNQILREAPAGRQVQYALLAFTGMRSGELQRLRREDVDLRGNWLHIVSRSGAETKTRKSRKVPIHPRLKTLLEAVPPSKHTWFFTASPSTRYPQGGNWVNPKRLNEDLQKVLRKLEIPTGRKEDGFTVHSLRHFFKPQCIHCGVPREVVDTWQGHTSDRSVSAQYYKLSDAESQRFMKMVLFDTGMSAADADDD